MTAPDPDCRHPEDAVRSVPLLELDTRQPVGIALACSDCGLLVTVARQPLEADR